MGKDTEKKSRYTLLLGFESELVNIKPVYKGANIVDWLSESGFFSTGMNGPVQLTWQDLNAWREGVGARVTTEECLIMRMLSREYCAQYHKSDDRNEPCPTFVEVKDKKSLSDKISRILDSRNPSK